MCVWGEREGVGDGEAFPFRVTPFLMLHNLFCEKVTTYRASCSQRTQHSTLKRNSKITVNVLKSCIDHPDADDHPDLPTPPSHYSSNVNAVGLCVYKPIMTVSLPKFKANDLILA